MKEKTASKTPTQTEQKRQDILKACAEEFCSHGYAGARIDRIAERAAVSKRTLYRHFPGKDVMFSAIMKRTFMPLEDLEMPVSDPSLTPEEQLHRLLTAYMNYITGDEYITLSRVVVSEFIHDPAHSRMVHGRIEFASGPLETLLEKFMNEGCLRKDDPAYAALKLTAPLKAIFYWPAFFTGALPPSGAEASRLINDCLDMFFSHYAVGK